MAQLETETCQPGQLMRMLLHAAWLAVAAGGTLYAAASPAQAGSEALRISVDAKDGSYAIAQPRSSAPVLRATAAIRVDDRWLRASDYPSHTFTRAAVKGALGDADEWTIRYSGRQDAPELICRVRSYRSQPFGEIQVTARNATGKTLHVEAFRLLDASGGPLLDLGGPPAADRVLSDSFSEDRPAMKIRDLADAEKQMHRGVGSQLVYNRQSHQSWFIGALTSDRFLSVMRLHLAGANGSKENGSAQAGSKQAGSTQIASYEVDSTGTTELTQENSLQDSSADDRVELSLPVQPGAELASERLLFSVSDDYHEQLEVYGRLIRDLHHARVSAPTPLGWWSWTAYYFGLNEGAALTNSEWLAQHLKPLGYTFFHMDEGYQFARGEYATPDATLFPHGVASLESQVLAQGLTPGIWTAPFEVSERSWVYEHHPEWLVHNAKGAPIHAGLVADGKDHLYILDPTHPGAQDYLRTTYGTLVHQWGIRYIKMDFMEDSAIEGYYHQPNITALEAQRIGLKTIRNAVGEQVLLDKDGSELLNPVGYVDMGRISQDTGHTFSSSKDAASGIAARYYMNRNFFVSDPDAFTVSQQTVDDQSWHGGERPLTFDEAKVSVALSAVSGGMFEIGDDLPSLAESPERVALVEKCRSPEYGMAGPCLHTARLDDLRNCRCAAEHIPAQGRCAAERTDGLQLDGARTHASDFASDARPCVWSKLHRH
ncbi:MAG: glycoside hydrolase family 36 protein [Acidobacteriaceae bacterium]